MLKNFNHVFKYLRHQKKRVIAASVLVFVEQGLRLAAPLVFGNVIDGVTTQSRFGLYALGMLLAWVLLDVLSGWAMRLRMRHVALIAYRASQELTQSSIAHVLRLPMQYHKDKKIGEVIQRITRADKYLYRIIEDGIFHIFPNIGGSLVSFGIICFINWKLSLAYLGFIIAYAVVTVRKTNPIIIHQKKLNKVFERIYGDIFDHTANILNIKSNTAETYEDNHHKKAFDKGSEHNYRAICKWMSLSSWQNSIKNISLFVLFGFSLMMVSQGSLSMGKLVTMIFYVNMLTANMQWLGGYYKNMQESLVTIARSEEIFSEEPEEYDHAELRRLENCTGEVAFQDISFSYGEEDVLKRISFTAKPGSMTAIVGKSGEGKSTLINLISKYILPRKGKILLDGIDIATVRLEDLRQQIAIVPQETELFNETIMNNIRYARMDATDDEVIAAAKLAQADAFIAKFPKQYAQIVGERGVKLSVGQKQRVAIARAILRDPKILVLDEATSALDSQSERLVQKALEEVMKNRTTFVIAHRLSTISKADQIIVLEGGMIAQRGTHRELIAHDGIYQKLSELQNITV